jgi:hypothetical protein
MIWEQGVFESALQAGKHVYRFTGNGKRIKPCFFRERLYAKVDYSTHDFYKKNSTVGKRFVEIY